MGIAVQFGQIFLCGILSNVGVIIKLSSRRQRHMTNSHQWQFNNSIQKRTYIVFIKFHMSTFIQAL